MSFSDEWNSIYKLGMQHTAWPWSDLVSLAHRYVPTGLSGRRVLELGCGTGANAPFFLGLGADYSAIEGSEAAVAVVCERFPALQSTVIVGDFTQSLPTSGPYDLIVDRASLTHNSTKDIQRTLELAWTALIPGGCYIGIDWFSDRHSDREFGMSADDENTFTQFTRGQFQGCGRVHFSDELHLRRLFSHFDVLFLAEKAVRVVEPKQDHLFASFNIVARKALD